MFIFYFALWVILNGRWTTEIGLFGLAFAAVVYVFSCKFMGYKLSVDIALLRRVPSALRYGFVLFVEIIKANLTVMRMVLDRSFEPQPQLVQFDVDLVRDRHRVALANSITLTPGTITVSLDGSHYVVHCLDKSLVDGLDDGTMPSLLVDMEKRHLAADAKRQAQKEEAAPVAAGTEPAVNAPAETSAAEEIPQTDSGVRDCSEEQENNEEIKGEKEDAYEH